MFNNFPKSTFEIVSRQGVSVQTVEGLFSKDSITIPDTSVVLTPGDELRRRIPNGTEETYEVLEPVFYERFGGIPAHFQVKVKRKGVYPAKSGGNYNIRINGNNARINIHSTDESTNYIGETTVFRDVRQGLERAEIPEEAYRALVDRLAKMEASQGNPQTYTSEYKEFITLAANYMTIVGPFLPALSQMLG